jgi:hypothetical protein
MMLAPKNLHSASLYAITARGPLDPPLSRPRPSWSPLLSFMNGGSGAKPPRSPLGESDPIRLCCAPSSPSASPTRPPPLRENRLNASA